MNRIGSLMVRLPSIERCIASKAVIKTRIRPSSVPTGSLSSIRPQSKLSTSRHSLLCRPFMPTSYKSLRTFATESDTIQGTIGKGASGVGDEARREMERLQAPEHLDEKERMIFEKLQELEPLSLEVCLLDVSCAHLCRHQGLGSTADSLWYFYAKERNMYADVWMGHRSKTSQVDAAPCIGLIL
jgi:hypothetical protein